MFAYQGDVVGARDPYGQVLGGRIRTLGAEHPETLGAMDNMGIVVAALETPRPAPTD